MSQLEKVPSKQRVPQNAYSLKLKSIRGAISYVIFSKNKPVLGLFLLYNFQIDSALIFPSGLNYR